MTSSFRSAPSPLIRWATTTAHIIGLVIVLSVSLFGASAEACICATFTDAAKAFERSDAVFYGEAVVVSGDHVRIRPLRHFKIPTSDVEFDVRLPASSCNLDYEVGGRYLMFVWRQNNGAWVTGDRCAVPNLAQFRTPISPFTSSIVNVSRKEDPTVSGNLHMQRQRIKRAVRGEVVSAIEACITEDVASIDLLYTMKIRSDGEFMLGPTISSSGHAPPTKLHAEFRRCWVANLLDTPALEPFDGQDIELMIHATAETPTFVELSIQEDHGAPRESSMLLGERPNPPRLFSIFARLWDAQLAHDTLATLEASADFLDAGHPAAALRTLNAIQPQTTLDRAVQLQALSESHLALAEYDEASSHAHEASDLTEGLSLRLLYLRVIVAWAIQVEHHASETNLIDFATQQGWNPVAFKRLALGAARIGSFLDWAALANLWAEAGHTNDAIMAHAMSLRSGPTTPVLLARARKALARATLDPGIAARLKRLGVAKSPPAAIALAQAHGIFVTNRAIMFSREVTPEPIQPRPWTPPNLVKPHVPTRFSLNDPGALFAAIAIVATLGLALRRAL